MAVRGLSASKRASTARLKPMAALRALTMQTTIQPTCAHENGVGAPRQQRAGERERQREHRVAEADERQVGGESGHAVCGEPGRHPRDVGRGDAGHQVFFHVPHAGRQAHADAAPRACPARSCRSRRRSPAPRAPTAVALSSSRRAGTPGARRRACGELAEQIQVVDAGQAVGAERHGHAGVVERRQRRRRPRRRRRCCADTSTTVAPMSRRRAMSSAVHCTPCTTSVDASRKPRCCR